MDEMVLYVVEMKMVADKWTTMDGFTREDEAYEAIERKRQEEGRYHFIYRVRKYTPEEEN